MHDLNDLPNVKVINSQLNQSDIEVELFKYAEDNGYDYLDTYNDVDVFEEYATIGFEIDQQQVLTKTKLDYVFVTLKVALQLLQLHFIQNIQLKIKLKLLELCCMALQDENQQSVLKQQKDLLMKLFLFQLKKLKMLNVNQPKQMKLQNSIQPLPMLTAKKLSIKIVLLFSQEAMQL